jgi:hypothetical protein
MTTTTPSSHPSDDQPRPVSMIPDAGGAVDLHDGRVTLHPGDCLQVLADMPPDSHHACVTDPPYHFASIIKRWSKAGPGDRTAAGAIGRHSRGFMGQTWDGGDIAFQPETWAAVYRALKPGAHLVAAQPRVSGRHPAPLEPDGAQRGGRMNVARETSPNPATPLHAPSAPVTRAVYLRDPVPCVL